MKIALVDDVPIYNRQLRKLLEDYFHEKNIHHTIAEYTCGKSLLSFTPPRKIVRFCFFRCCSAKY